LNLTVVNVTLCNIRTEGSGFAKFGVVS
jgi:hypothetical protein